MKIKRNILHVGLLLAIVLAMTATTAFASPSDLSTLKPKHTPDPAIGTTEVTTTEVAPTEVTPAPHGNSDHHKNTEKGNQAETKVKKTNFRGTVLSSTETSLTVTLKNGSEQVFTIDENTIIKYPTHFIPAATEEATATVEATVDPSATATEVAAGPLAGLEVAVKAALQEDDTYLALTVMVIPGKPVKVHHVGVVTNYTAGESIEITAKDGTVAVFELAETTKYLPEGSIDTLKVGDTVTIIMPRVLTNQPWIAAGVVLHSDTETDTEAPEGD